MTAEFDPTSQEAMALFSHAHTVAGSIGDINDRHDSMLADPLLQDAPQFRDIAVSTLKEEQEQAFAELTAVPHEPYEQVQLEHDKASAAAAMARIALAEAKQTVQNERSRYCAIIKVLMKYAPDSEDSAKELAEEYMSGFASDTMHGLEEAVVSGEARLAAMDAIYEFAGRAWPIPKLLREQEQEAVATEAAATPDDIDQQLEEPETLDPEVESAETVVLNKEAQIVRDQELVKRIEAGELARYYGTDRAKEWEAHLQTLSPERQELLKTAVQECMKDGEIAKAELYKQYNGLVKFIARNVYDQLPSLRKDIAVSFDDLHQIGWEHAMKAVYRYASKEEPGAPLKVYIANFMREYIKKEVYGQLYAIRLPAGMDEKVRKVQAINSGRLQHQMPILSNEEISELTGLPLGFLGDRRINVSDVHESIRQTRLMGSLDRGLSPGADFSMGDDYTLYDIVNMEDDDEAFIQASAATLSDMLARVLQTVSEREAGVIKHLFGLTDGLPRSLDEVGQIYGVTRERIRQIESKVMSKLRHPARSQQLRGYIYDEDEKTRGWPSRASVKTAAPAAKFAPRISTADYLLRGTGKAAPTIEQPAKVRGAAAAHTDRLMELIGNAATTSEARERLGAVIEEGQTLAAANKEVLGGHRELAGVVRLRKALYEHVIEHNIYGPELSLERGYVRDLVYHAIEKITHATIYGNEHNDYNREAIYGWSRVLNGLVAKLQA